jgi:hypothetical protein
MLQIRVLEWEGEDPSFFSSPEFEIWRSEVESWLQKGSPGRNRLNKRRLPRGVLAHLHIEFNIYRLPGGEIRTPRPFGIRSREFVPFLGHYRDTK